MRYLLLCAIAFGSIALFFHAKRTLLPSPNRHSDVLIVGTNAEYQPYSFLNEKQEIVGLDIDIATEIAHRIDKKIEIHNMAFEALLPEIMLGTIHIIAAGMTPTNKRAERVFFTAPHVEGDPLIAVVRKEDASAFEARGIASLNGKQIAVNQGYFAETYASTITDVRIIHIVSAMVSEGILALKSHRADAYMIARSALLPFMRSKQDNTVRFFELADSGGEAVALIVSKKYPELKKEIDAAIESMKKDGTLAIIKQKWGFSE